MVSLHGKRNIVITGVLYESATNTFIRCAFYFEREDMREILFRGKNCVTNNWVYGNYCAAEYLNSNGVEHLIIEVPRNGVSARVIPETVGQYTGLTDKNGKKIFEGDIVRAYDYVFSIKYGKCGGTPNADNYGYMGFYLEAVSEGTKLCARYGLRDDICYFTDIAVIGNIHDNPELM